MHIILIRLSGGLSSLFYNVCLTSIGRFYIILILIALNLLLFALDLLILYFTHVFLFLLVVVLPREGKGLRCSDSRFGLHRLRQEKDNHIGWIDKMGDRWWQAC